MTRPSYGPQAHKQARCLLDVLLRYANQELGDDKYIEAEWIDNKLSIETSARHLEYLVKRGSKGDKLTSHQIKEALKRYQDLLGISKDKRTKAQGSKQWCFELTLWFGPNQRDKNLEYFDEAWQRCRLKKLKNSGETLKYPPDGEASSEISEIDRLVQSIREKGYHSIQARCGCMRVLDMPQPMKLDDIYTTASIYECISGRRRYGLMGLSPRRNLKDLTYLGQIQESQTLSLTDTTLKQYSKLIVFGKPGAGKTTLLKWLAIQCNKGHLWMHLIPVFISIKTFAESKEQPRLQDFIYQQWVDYGCGLRLAESKEILQEGRALILLDGLDEVKETDRDKVLQEIREFSTQFYKCLFVITCRNAAREYLFEQFTEVEIADFDEQQVTKFVTQWFAAKKDTEKTSQFLRKLKNYRRIKDLATNPLLLTLLCLVFQEFADFPSNCSELYREALEVLLKTWDAKRNIQRDSSHQQNEVYQKLPLQYKEALLSQIAFTTFERGDYLFKKSVIVQYVNDFLCDLPVFKNKLLPWEINGEAVLKSIECQHGLLVERVQGIYSFSHLTFHEYFVARKIANSPKMQLKEELKKLVNYVVNKEWYEVFILTATMLQNADELLLMMKEKIDSLLASDPKLQDFLKWLNERVLSATKNSNNVEVYYKPSVARAYYSFLLLDNPSIQASASAITSAVNHTSLMDKKVMDLSPLDDSEESIASIISKVSDRQRAIAIAIVISSSINSAKETFLERASAISNALEKAISLTPDLALTPSLQHLKSQLPDIKEDLTILKQWWKDYGNTWSNQLKELQLQYRNLIYDWQFSESQMTLLEQYYRANLLLVDCLMSDCAVTPSVQDELESTLLLAIKDIEQYKSPDRSSIPKQK